MSAGYRTLQQITDEVSNTFQDTSTARKSRIKEAIAREYLNYANALPWPQLIQIEQDAISIASGDKYFYTPYRMGRILGIFPSGQPLKLDPVGIAGYLRRHGQLDDLGTSGWMSSYTHVGTSGKKAEFPSNDKIILTPGTEDNSANGALTINCVIHGVSNSDEVIEDVVISNGFSQTSSNSFSELYSVSTDGTQTVALFASGLVNNTTIFARIPGNQQTARYQKYRVGQAPSEAKTLTVAYKKEPIAWNNDNMVPEIPISDALYHKALATLYRSMRKPGPVAQSEDAQADAKVQAAFDQSVVQGETAPQAAPIERYQYLPGKRSR
jgi:hypothetical protein